MTEQGRRDRGSAHQTTREAIEDVLRFPPGVTVCPRATTASTNADARALAIDGAPHLTLVWAERQEGGRGRGSRAWHSPPGNVYWSLLLRPEAHWPDISQLAHVSALAVHAALRPHVPAQRAVALKWPNDTLIDGRKVAGILIEASGVATGTAARLTARFIVVGIGINVRHHPATAALHPATSLAAEGSTADRDRMLVDLTEAFLGWLARWTAEGFESLRLEYLRHAHGLGARATVRLSSAVDDVVSGIHEGVDADGRLLLRLDDGALRVISAGDVFFNDDAVGARRTTGRD